MSIKSVSKLYELVPFVVVKVKKIKKPFARKIQILTVGEQRAKVMGKNQVVSIFKKGKEAIRKQRKA